MLGGPGVLASDHLSNLEETSVFGVPRLRRRPTSRLSMSRDSGQRLEVQVVPVGLDDWGIACDDRSPSHSRMASSDSCLVRPRTPFSEPR